MKTIEAARAISHKTGRRIVDRGHVTLADLAALRAADDAHRVWVCLRIGTDDPSHLDVADGRMRAGESCLARDVPDDWLSRLNAHRV